MSTGIKMMKVLLTAYFNVSTCALSARGRVVRKILPTDINSSGMHKVVNSMYYNGKYNNKLI